MKIRPLFTVLIVLGCFFVSGCATIIKGSDQVMNFNTDPTQAKCIITNLRTGQEVAHLTTPSATTLKKGDGYFTQANYKVSCEKEGYEKKEVALDGNITAWYLAGNILLGGLIGWFIVDPLTGAMYYFEPENISMVLPKITEVKPPAPPQTPVPPEQPKNLLIK